MYLQCRNARIKIRGLNGFCDNCLWLEKRTCEICKINFMGRQTKLCFKCDPQHNDSNWKQVLPADEPFCY